jgi:hypothetical protein
MIMMTTCDGGNNDDDDDDKADSWAVWHSGSWRTWA